MTVSGLPRIPPSLLAFCTARLVAFVIKSPKSAKTPVTGASNPIVIGSPAAGVAWAVANCRKRGSLANSAPLAAPSLMIWRRDDRIIAHSFQHPGQLGNSAVQRDVACTRVGRFSSRVGTAPTLDPANTRPVLFVAGSPRLTW